MDKLKQYKYILIPGIIVLGFVFYWTEVRSVLIKKECSQYTEPADLGITKEQADLNRRKYNTECPKNPEIGPSVECFLLERRSVETPFQPEKIRDESKKEYDTCLRRNGL